MRTKVAAIVVIVVGLALTAAGLFGQFVLTEDEGHHDGREPTFALASAQGTDELIVVPSGTNQLDVSIERAGQRIESFGDVHDAGLHVFAVRTDLSEYLHVDDPAGPIEVAGGEYRVVAQAAPSGGPDLLELGTTVSTTGEALLSGQTITASNEYELPSGLTVERQGFDFVLSAPWQGEDHHGGPALLVMFRADDGAFVHAHAEVPNENRFRFNLDLPGQGDYLAALEFVNDGVVETALFRVRL